MVDSSARDDIRLALLMEIYEDAGGEWYDYPGPGYWPGRGGGP